MKFPKNIRNGGIPVDLHRDWPISSPINNSFLPTTAVVPMKQHAGPSARMIVRRGEFVREGSIIGKGDNAGIANIHSPIPGVIRDIHRIRLPYGGECDAAVISLEGSFDRLGKKSEKYLWRRMSRNDILQTLRDRGIVETDLPGLPIFDLLYGKTKTTLLILSCMESEPYLRTESSVLSECLAEVLEGLLIFNKTVSADRCIIVLDGTIPSSRERIENIVKSNESSIDIVTINPRYPLDNRNQLLKVLTGGKQASYKDALVVRPSTALAVYEAIVLAKPFVERYITITGGAVKNPAILKVRIGTPIGDLIEECGGLVGSPERVILGGPFRGYAVYDLDTPITKQTSAVLVLSRTETKDRRVEPCIRCGHCADKCPEKLDPAAIFRLLVAGHIAESLKHGLLSCTACGICGYVCPSRIKLGEVILNAVKKNEAS